MEAGHWVSAPLWFGSPEGNTGFCSVSHEYVPSPQWMNDTACRRIAIFFMTCDAGVYISVDTLFVCFWTEWLTHTVLPLKSFM